MKKLLPYIVLLILLAGCGALRQIPEEKQRISEAVTRRLDAVDYRIEVSYMIPLRGGGKAVSGGYSVAVESSVVHSHLPYAGVARTIPYGGGKGLSFTDDVDEYSDSGWRKGERVIVFSTNNDEDIIVYTLTIFDNGEADIHVHCRNRDDISFRGTLDTRGE